MHKRRGRPVRSPSSGRQQVWRRTGRPAQGCELGATARDTRPLAAPGTPVCEPHDSTGEPGAGNRPAGFGERGEETCLRDSDCGPARKRRMSHRTLPVTRLSSTLPYGWATSPRQMMVSSARTRLGQLVEPMAVHPLDIAERPVEGEQDAPVDQVEVAPDARLLRRAGDDRYRPLVAAGESRSNSGRSRTASRSGMRLMIPRWSSELPVGRALRAFTWADACPPYRVPHPVTASPALPASSGCRSAPPARRRQTRPAGYPPHPRRYSLPGTR